MEPNPLEASSHYLTGGRELKQESTRKDDHRADVSKVVGEYSHFYNYYLDKNSAWNMRHQTPWRCHATISQGGRETQTGLSNYSSEQGVPIGVFSWEQNRFSKAVSKYTNIFFEQYL